ncbi:MAG: 1-acyl-sn-glycerol-3-phosphate acyltransferase [Spirochaetaceae bacterium]|jgi:1-acyl-sn-glycerol-3-phosphate acyltransferase|nr:1-acyl-sn-glycerol-3-phosphate acyltransferase [Spirochaetaceae bacterium]
MIKRFFITAYVFFVITIAAATIIPVAVFLGLISLIGLRKTSSELMYKSIKTISLFILFCTGFKLTVSGAENIPPRGKTGLCFVCNHTGILDVLLLFIAIGRPFGFISKKEIMYVPFINLWLVLLGGIFMDRKNPRKSFDAIKRGAEKIKKGHSMAIFPEGTRSRGQGLLPFRTGSFHLATDSGADIVPVALTGSYEAFEKTKLVHPRPVYVSFGKTIKTSLTDGGKNRQHFSDQARAEIAELLELQQDEYGRLRPPSLRAP